MAHDVFISYSAHDKPAADAVCAKLESRGIGCWIAPRDIRPGMSWGGAIVEAIDGARVMLLLFSSHANGSPQIQREVERAVHKEIVIVPVRVEDVSPTGDFAYFLSTPHWLDAFPPPFEQYLEHIANTAKSWLGSDSEILEPQRRPPAPSRPKLMALSIIASVIALVGIVAFFGARYYFVRQVAAARLQTQPTASEHSTAARTFRDCTECPEMVVVPAGTFTMGSPSSEPERYVEEGPQHWVTIGHAFAVGKYPVTRDEYARFASVTKANSEWQNPGFAQTGRDPVVNVNWNDAQAYVAWLSAKTGKSYRLLSESEYEYAERAGTMTTYWWGDNSDQLCSYVNGDPCHHIGTVPVGSYPANAFGLYDMAGNVWEYTEDCWHESYAGAPDDGTSWKTGTCRERVERGGSWGYGTRNLRSAERDDVDANDRTGGNGGFRVARTL